MDNSAKFDQIIAKLRLTSDVKQAHVCLDEFAANFFSPNAAATLETFFNRLPGDLPQIFRELFLTTPVTIENQLEYKKQIDQLAEKLGTVKTIQLTLAFKPDTNAIVTFSDWVKKNISIDTVIDIQYDQSIVGGAQMIYNGMYKDYSVRKNIASTFQIQKEEIMNLLK